MKTITIKGTINFWMIFYKICQCESAAAKLWDVRQVIMEQPFALHDPKSPTDRKPTLIQVGNFKNVPAVLFTKMMEY